LTSSEQLSTKNTKNHKGRNSSRLFVNFVDTSFFSARRSAT
jgi:hypothetical protein